MKSMLTYVDHVAQTIELFTFLHCSLSLLELWPHRAVQLCSCSGLEFADVHGLPLMCAGNVAALNLGKLQNQLGQGGTGAVANIANFNLF